MAKYLAAVRYGMMRQTENFHSEEENLTAAATVIIKTGRGVEWGEIAGAITPIDREVKGLGEILRTANERDFGIIRHIQEDAHGVELHQFDMQIVDYFRNGNTSRTYLKRMAFDSVEKTYESGEKCTLALSGACDNYSV